VKIKEKILRISIKLFIERGFQEVSVNDLVRESYISISSFNNYFESKDQLICETIEKFMFPYFDDILRIAGECGGFSKNKLLKIFREYSEIESYLKNNFNINKISHRSINFLTTEGIKKYETISKYMTNFNNRLLQKIELIIEEGKKLGEISSTVVSKTAAMNILESLKSSTVLWIMNQSIDIKLLFETNFKHLWNEIKSPESSFEF
jgi:AcrR family transcriptional regulator